MNNFIAGIVVGAVLSLSSMVAYRRGKQDGAIHTDKPNIKLSKHKHKDNKTYHIQKAKRNDNVEEGKDGVLR